MTDDIASITRDLEAVVAAATAALERVRALPARASSDFEPNDWVRPGRIVKDFVVSRGHLPRLCARHPISGPDGLALRAAGGF